MAGYSGYQGYVGYENLPLRQKIAMAMLGRSRKLPSNLGEGLGAIGEAIGDIGTERRLLAADKTAQEEAQKLLGVPEAPEAPAAPSAYSPPSQTSPETPPETSPAPPVATSTGAGLGTPMEYEPGDYNPLDQASDLADQRKPYVAQLNADPAAKLKMAALMSAEEGTGATNSTARQALAETIFNRGTSRGYGNVHQVMDPRYYQPMHERGGAPYAAHVAKLQSDPAYRAQVFSEIDRVGGEGTNISNLATDNASGDVAARSMGNQTLTYTAPNEEKFFRKDIRPDVHGKDVVPATAAWAQGLATAAPVDSTGQPPRVMAFSGAPQDGAVPFNAQNFLPMGPGSSPIPPAGAAALAPPSPQAPPQIAQAPPPPIRQAPPIQMAQAAMPQAGYVAPEKPEPPPPAPSLPSRREQELALISQANPHVAPFYEQMKSAREQAHARQVEAYKDQLQTTRAWNLERQKQLADQAGRITGVEKDRAMAEETRLKNAATVAFGNVPDDIRKELFASKKVAQSSVQSLNAAQEANAALQAGIISGAGADWKLVGAKFLSGMGFTGKELQDKIANTETFQASMQPIIASILHQTSGTSQLSEGELMFARQMAAGKISLDPESFPRIMAIIQKASTNTVADHQGRINTIVGDSPTAQAIFGVKAPARTEVVGTGPRAFKSEAEVEAAKLPRGTKVIINGRPATVQ